MLVVTGAITHMAGLRKDLWAMRSIAIDITSVWTIISVVCAWTFPVCLVVLGLVVSPIWMALRMSVMTVRMIIWMSIIGVLSIDSVSVNTISGVDSWTFMVVLVLLSFVFAL